MAGIIFSDRLTTSKHRYTVCATGEVHESAIVAAASTAENEMIEWLKSLFKPQQNGRAGVVGQTEVVEVLIPEGAKAEPVYLLTRRNVTLHGATIECVAATREARDAEDWLRGASVNIGSPTRDHIDRSRYRVEFVMAHVLPDGRVVRPYVLTTYAKFGQDIRITDSGEVENVS